MNTIDITTTKFAIFRSTEEVEVSAKIGQLKKILVNEIVTFCHGLILFISEKIELSTICRQLVKHIDFDVVKSGNILNFKDVYCGINI